MIKMACFLALALPSMLLGYEQFVDVDGAKLFCRVVGEGDPIIVLHSDAVGHDYLVPHCDELAKHHQVIYYDQRAAGQSTGEITLESMSLGTFLGDLDAVRNAFGHAQITLMGHGFGSLIALCYALEHPESVSQLVLANPVPVADEEVSPCAQECLRRRDPYLAELAALMEDPRYLAGEGDLVERFNRLIVTPHCYRSESIDQIDLKMTPKASHNRHLIHDAVARAIYFEPFNFYGDMEKMNVPTLIVTGKACFILPFVSERIHEHIPNSKLVTIERCGTYPFVEQPDQFFEAVEQFLDSGV